MHAWDCLLDDAPEWIEMNAHKRKQANNDLNHADYFWVSLSLIHMTPSTIFSAGCTVLKKFYMPELKRPLIADVILQPGDAWITARLCRLAVPCHVLMSEGRDRQLVFCVGCSFSARMHSTTVSTMSGRVYPTGVSTPISRR